MLRSLHGYRMFIIALLCLLWVVLLSLSIDQGGLNWHWLLPHDDSLQSAIVWRLRMPRLVTAILVGGALALAGAMLQTLLANPVAEPGLVGISGGASFAAVAALFVTSHLNWTALPQWQLASGFAFVGALASCWLIVGAQRWLTVDNQERLILLGVALATLTSALTAWLIYFSNDGLLRNIQFWLLGFLGAAQPWQLMVAAIIIALVLAWAVIRAPAFNLLLSGEQNARLMGLDTARFRHAVVFAVALLTGLAVAMAGPIGFIGLLVPHFVRLVKGDEQRMLMATSFVVGSGLLVVADMLAQHLLTIIALPVGIVTASIGAPVFIGLLLRGRL